MTYEEEQAFLKRHIEAAQDGEFVTVNQLFEAYQKEIGHTSTRDGFYYLLKRHALFSLFVHFFSSSVTELKHNLSLSILAFFLLDL